MNMLKLELETILPSFSSVSLLEMDAVKLMDRFDTKFLLSEPQFLEVLKKLRNDYSVLEIEGKRSFYYESTYLDDERFTFFRDHHAGKTHRFKVRYRDYVDAGISFLEVKERTKGHTVKKRIPATNSHDLSIPEELEFVEQLIHDNMCLKPVLKNSYNRITLVSKDQKERLTFDYHLHYYRDQHEFEFSGLVIAELKQEKVDRNSLFYALMKNQMIRPLRVSKYCLGIMNLFKNEGLNFNRFKSKQLKINKLIANAA